jgi:hypothetical protein
MKDRRQRRRAVVVAGDDEAEGVFSPAPQPPQIHHLSPRTVRHEHLGQSPAGKHDLLKLRKASRFSAHPTKM